MGYAPSRYSLSKPGAHGKARVVERAGTVKDARVTKEVRIAREARAVGPVWGM